MLSIIKITLIVVATLVVLYVLYFATVGAAFFLRFLLLRRRLKRQHQRQRKRYGLRLEPGPNVAEPVPPTSRPAGRAPAPPTRGRA